MFSGGVGEDEQLLDSVEFYSLEDQTWKEMAPLKVPRTEHGQYLPHSLVSQSFIKLEAPTTLM